MSLQTSTEREQSTEPETIPGDQREPLTPVPAPKGPEPDYFTAELARIFRSTPARRRRHRLAA